MFCKTQKRLALQNKLSFWWFHSHSWWKQSPQMQLNWIKVDSVSEPKKTEIYQDTSIQRCQKDKKNKEVVRSHIHSGLESRKGVGVNSIILTSNTCTYYGLPDWAYDGDWTPSPFLYLLYSKHKSNLETRLAGAKGDISLQKPGHKRARKSLQITVLNHSSLAIRRKGLSGWVCLCACIWVTMSWRRTKGCGPQLYQEKGHTELGKGQ